MDEVNLLKDFYFLFFFVIWQQKGAFFVPTPGESTVKYIVSLYSMAMTNSQPNTPLAGPECVLTLYFILITPQNDSLSF